MNQTMCEHTDQPGLTPCLISVIIIYCLDRITMIPVTLKFKILARLYLSRLNRARQGLEVIKIFMLSSTWHEIYPPQKCKNANYCWHFNIY